MSPRSAARNGSHKNKPMRVLVVSILLVTAAAASLVVWMTARAYAPEFSAPIAREDHDWATSDTCRTCHADHYASWHRTFHRTMTQEATSKTVRGVFDGRKIRYYACSQRISTQSCAQAYVRADHLEEQIMSDVKTLFRDDAFLDRVWKEANRLLGEEKPQVEREIVAH